MPIIMHNKEYTFDEFVEEMDARWKNRPMHEKILINIKRFINKIKDLLEPRYKVEKEHRQVGLTRQDSPYKKYEIWNLYHVLAWITYPKLVRYKHAERVGTVVDLSQEEWEQALDSMLYAMQMLCSDEVYEIEEYAKIAKGLELFGKYFNDLWD